MHEASKTYGKVSNNVHTKYGNSDRKHITPNCDYNYNYNTVGCVFETRGMECTVDTSAGPHEVPQIQQIAVTMASEGLEETAEFLDCSARAPRPQRWKMGCKLGIDPSLRI